jgi:ubiquinone/menaquinone biosynthesis C-methylase UbiE
MMGLANERLMKWRECVEMKVSDGSKHIDAPDEAFDRFVSTYVPDVLSPENSHSVISEAHRVLRKGGKLCLESMTEGRNMPGRMVTWMWKRVYSVRPRLVGGCRPIELLDYLSPGLWLIEYCKTVASFWIASEIVIASPKPSHG